MPEVVQNVMLAAPTTHFVELAQAILFRGAGPAVVWPQMLALGAIGSVFSSVPCRGCANPCIEKTIHAVPFE